MRAYCLSRLHRYARIAGVGLLMGWLTATAGAQPIGVEMHNTVLPASGGMGGASIARPQELLAGVNGNPAAMTQFGGTQFQFAGGYAEATFNFNQTANLPLPGVTPFAGKSDAPGVSLANIGMSRQSDLFGADVVTGFALISNAGAGVDFSGIPASNGTRSSMLVLEMVPTVGVRLTERLSVGANAQLGSAYFDGPFIGAGSMVQAFGLRAGLGINYDVGDATTIGAYWQSNQHFNFPNAIRLQLFNNTLDVSRSVRMDLPETIGLGIANRSLCDGRLLLAFDALFKQWEEADLFNAVYRNQWALQIGSQYSIGRLRLRSGYCYAQNPLKPATPMSVGGITLPGGVPAIQYLDAQFANVIQNRISAGIGIVDLKPGLDFDVHAGGGFKESATLGTTEINIESWWAGFGMTYRFGAQGVPKTP